MALVVALWAVPAGAGQPAMVEKQVRSCGPVVAAYCGGRGSVSFVLELKPGVVLTISADKIADQAAAQLAATKFVEKRACATGRLTRANAPFEAAIIELNELTDLSLEEKGPPINTFAPGAAHLCDPDVRAPVVEREVRPNYTAAALGAKVQGAVWVQVLISPKGRVEKARVIRSIDPQLGLDQEALTAAKRWRFRPASRRGQPIPVVAVIQLSFTLE